MKMHNKHVTVMILVLLSLLICACLPSAGVYRPPDLESHYVGRWNLYQYADFDSSLVDTTDLIVLYSDSTFTCSFNLFTEDSSEVEGTWYLSYQMEYYDAIYTTINFRSADLHGSWKVRVIENETQHLMKWFELDWSTDVLLCSWSYAGGAHLPPDEQEDKK